MLRTCCISCWKKTHLKDNRNLRQLRIFRDTNGSKMYIGRKFTKKRFKCHFHMKIRSLYSIISNSNLIVIIIRIDIKIGVLLVINNLNLK